MSSEKSKLFFEKLGKARQDSLYLGHLCLYCDNQDCCAREVSVKVKEYMGMTIESMPKCPICGEYLKTHNIGGVK